jgi:electron transfer flavoprotein beta subunit
MAAKKKEIVKWSASELGLDGSGIGADSKTKINKVSPPPPRPKGEFIEGENAEEIAEKLFNKLREDQIL